jgi:hypothetical protein
MLDAILAKTRHMKLKICTDTTIRSFLARRLAIENPFYASFAIAQDRTASMPGGLLASSQEPFAIFGGDQDPCVEASKGFGISVIDELLPTRRLPRLRGR